MYNLYNSYPFLHHDRIKFHVIELSYVQAWILFVFPIAEVLHECFESKAAHVSDETLCRQYEIRKTRQNGEGKKRELEEEERA